MANSYPTGSSKNDPSMSLAVPSSTMKLSGLSSPSQSLTSSNVPQLDLGFDKLRNRMDHFLTSFDRYISQGRQNILENRNNYSKTIIELRGKHPLFG